MLSPLAVTVMDTKWDAHKSLIKLFDSSASQNWDLKVKIQDKKEV